MTPRELALGQLGHGPTDVAMLAGLLMQHRVSYLDSVRVAKAELEALVASGHAEVMQMGRTMVFRLSARTPMQADDEPPTTHTREK